MTEQIKAFGKKKAYTFYDIAELVAILRSEDGCAWDREQTHASVRNAMIEETYEFIEGLDKNDLALMREELGDVMFQVFFHAQIAKENGEFTLDDVADELCKKMVLRHPHVFGDVTVENSAEVLKNWDAIKKTEKSRDTLKKQLESVSSALPSLIRAEKLLSRSKREGLYVERDPQILIENIKKLVEALSIDSDEKTLGDLLFAVTNLGYALKINSEQALYHCNERYIADRLEENKEL